MKNNDVLLFVLIIAAGALLICGIVIGDTSNTLEGSLVDLLENAGFENIKVYGSGELTSEMIANRQGTTIVERCYGVITDMETRDGRVMNTGEMGNYISYRSVHQTVNENSIILTYLVWNPENNACDDVILRYDFVMGESR